MAPSRRMSLPYDQRIRPERKEQLKKALMNHAVKECLAIKGDPHFTVVKCNCV